VQEQVYEELFRLEDHHWWFAGRRSVLWAMLRRAGIVKPMRVLDAGCGTGRNLQVYGVLGRAYGVDISEDAVEFCRRRGLSKVQQASLDALPFGEGAFDLVLACDVLEHIADDRAALKELRRVTSPDGRLVITVPAYGWLWSQHDEMHHHVRRYTRHVLVDRVQASGWRPVLTTHFNSILLPPIALVRGAQRLGFRPAHTDYDMTPGWLNSMLEMPLRAEAKAIQGGWRLPAGVSIGMVCVPA
jgi:SAM-dependent methyltransferase